MTYKRLFISKLSDINVRDVLGELCEKVILIEPNSYLPKPVSTHADMQLLYIDDTLVLTRELYMRLSGEFPDNIIISFADNNHTDKYPGDSNLNALYHNGKLFANERFLDPAVKRVCKSKGITIVNVKQGYTRCSTLPIGDDSLITADSGIAKVAKEHGFDVLLINPGQIELTGYDYGFIGGSSFYDHNSRIVYFFGNLNTHCECEKILEFCNQKNVKIIFCNDSSLVDIGGVVAI